MEINKENIPNEPLSIYARPGHNEIVIWYKPGLLKPENSVEGVRFLQEAFNVFTESGMTPEELKKELLGANLMLEELGRQRDQIEQLQQQRDELLERIKKESIIEIGNRIESLNTQQEESDEMTKEEEHLEFIKNVRPPMDQF